MRDLFIILLMILSLLLSWDVRHLLDKGIEHDARINAISSSVEGWSLEWADHEDRLRTLEHQPPYPYSEEAK